METRALKCLILHKDNLLNLVLFIINECFTIGIYPNFLKVGRVLPLHKKDEREVFNNYRLVLPIVSKILY